jgi:hypothetical protein
MVLVLSGFYFSNAQVLILKTEGGYIFTEDESNVLFYQKDRKSMEGKYERCHYIHPLWGIDGTILTEDFPADHLHQRGVFWAWHQIRIDGRNMGDGWEIDDFDQEVKHVEFETQKNGIAVMKTEVDWSSKLCKTNGIKSAYLKENTRIFVHPKKENYRRIDFEISLLALEENLVIGGSEDVKGYGGFSVRMVLPDDVLFTGPSGEIQPKNEAVESNGYVNISGSIGQNNSRGGVVMVDHRQNPDYPQSWILRKKKSMQNAVYPGRDPISVSTETPLTLRYSLLVYSGNLSDAEIRNILKESVF